jgi:hypothetical protein
MRKNRETKEDCIVGYTLVDEADYEEVSRKRWGMIRSGRTCYAMRSQFIPGTASGAVAIYLHRMLLGLQPGGGHAIEADHINFDGLDNRRSNLRVVTRDEQNQGRRKFKNNKTGETGICFSDKRRGGHWLASIRRGGETIIHKAFYTREEAIAARDAALLAYEAKRHQESA